MMNSCTAIPIPIPIPSTIPTPTSSTEITTTTTTTNTNTVDTPVAPTPPDTAVAEVVSITTMVDSSMENNSNTGNTNNNGINDDIIGIDNPSNSWKEQQQMITNINTNTNTNTNTTTVLSMKYKYLVVDSGPIIRMTGVSQLWNHANEYYTVPNVMNEIRDAKARQHLDTIPFLLNQRQPSNDSIRIVSTFARQTGDYPSLSTTDIHVLALVYELEKESCNGSIQHIRTKPRKNLALAKSSISTDTASKNNTTSTNASIGTEPSSSQSILETTNSTTSNQQAQPQQVKVQVQEQPSAPVSTTVKAAAATTTTTSTTSTTKPRTWAQLVGGTTSSNEIGPRTVVCNISTISDKGMNSTIDTLLNVPFGKMDLQQTTNNNNKKEGDDDDNEKEEVCHEDGQFNDADEDNDEDDVETDDDDDDDEDDDEDDDDDDFSCDDDSKNVDEEDEDIRNSGKDEVIDTTGRSKNKNDRSDGLGLVVDSATSIEQDQTLVEFPILSSTVIVPFTTTPRTDEKEERQRYYSELSVMERKQLEEQQRILSLQPLSKSGRLYNSFKNVNKLMKPKQPIAHDSTSTAVGVTEKMTISTTTTLVPLEHQQNDGLNNNSNTGNNNSKKGVVAAVPSTSSRLFGSSGYSGQDDNVDDDGEGWIRSTVDISVMKAMGTLDPYRSKVNKPASAAAASTTSAAAAVTTNENDKTEDNAMTNGTKRRTGNRAPRVPPPPISQRTACATTDFAMQNVLLQMNLELLSVDGMKINKLKTFVTRCGACYKVYTTSEYRVGGRSLPKRLFCDHCGSSLMQRIAASVDSATGRLRLHLSHKHKVNLRGTQYSLPKPGTHNKYQGDLLLREDQLLTGAWNYKLKMRSGGTARNAAESIFGNDIARNVGCNKQSMSFDDIQVGFGRRNPNSVKGRERRGKKKKSTDKACGLRRY